MSELTVALKITDFEFEPSSLNEMLQLTPTGFHLKGEEYFIGSPERRLKKAYENNYWEYRISIRENTVWVTTIFNQFVKEVIEGKKELLERIKNDCLMELYIGLGYAKEERLESFHFNIEVLKLLSQLNIEIDIDQQLMSQRISDGKSG
jgi:hypothetical protein